MKKSTLMSISPFWGFLIIAKDRGWDLAKYGLQKKTVEVRKSIPTSPDWDRKVDLYFTKDKRSLARIPEEYRGEVAKLCGKVVGEFVCDNVSAFMQYRQDLLSKTCLTNKELMDYIGEKDGYGLHISDLKIYDKPKELSEFYYPCTYPKNTCEECAIQKLKPHCHYGVALERPPQSWCYVEEQ